MFRNVCYILGMFVVGSTSAISAEFQWLNEHHEAVQLSSLKGKPVLLHLWASWCPPCRSELPALVAWTAEHPEVTVVLVSLDSDEEDAKAFFDQEAITLPLNMGVMRQALSLGARGLPTTLILDREGAVKRRYLGDIAWQNQARSAQILRELNINTAL